MAQNPYNNYIKRKAHTNVGINPIVAPKPNNNPSVGFKKRVVGNLGGNTLTPVTQTQKSQNTSSQTTNQYTTPPEANISPSNNVQPTNNINTQPTNAKAVVDAPVAPQANTATTETVTPMQVDNAPAMYATRSIDELNQINEIANEVIENPMMSRMARSTGKTPQQYAQELFEQQKTQLQKDWELKQQELKLQQEQAQKSWQTSVDDTDKKYNETVDKLNLNRYEQMQDLSVSATNRGLQYSPQQLGLENVANINHNKNLAEASKQRNEMLTQLNTKLMELQAQLTLGSQNAVNEYNKALGQLSADYNSKLMDWSYDKQMTAEERAWQEAQAQKDREWQEKMDKANKEWQSAENALDRKNGRSGGSYGGYGYSSSWKGNSGWKKYKGSGWSNYGDYGSGLSLDLASDVGSKAYTKTFKEMSTDRFNSLTSGNELETVQMRADIYKDEIDKEIEYARKSGASKKVIDELITTRDTALKHLYNQAYSNSTNTPYKINKNTIIQPVRPLRDDYIQSKKNTKISDRNNYIANNTLDKETKKLAEFKRDNMAKFEGNRKFTKYGVSKEISEKMRNGSYSNSKTTSSNNKTSTISKVAKNVAKAKSNTKTSVTNSKNNSKTSVKKAVSNVKKSTTSSKNNVKKSVSNAKKNTKKSTNNALNNLKKNISKLFKKKK